MTKEQTDQIDACQQCGQLTDELEEGYCAECHHERQSKLDQHNAAFDRWARMTPEQRDSEIKWASR